MGIGIGFTKLILDAQGKYEESSEIPGEIGQALGMAFDELYTGIVDEEFNGELGETIGALAELIIGVSASGIFKETCVDDSLLIGGLLASWMNDKKLNPKDYDKNLDALNEVIDYYNLIDKAKSNESSK